MPINNPFSHPECIPVPVIKHLRSCLKLQDWVKAIPSERQRYNYQNIIREYLGVKPYDKKAQKDLAIFVAAEAQIKDHPADLINVAIEKLVKDKYELPAFSTLDRLVSHIRHLTNNRLFQQVSQNLTSAEQNYLDQLLSSETEESTTNLNLLKSLPCSATLSGMKQLIVKFDAICEPLIKDYCRQLNLPGLGEDFVKYLQDQLTKVANEVDTLCADGKQFTINSKGEPVLKRLKSPPPSTEVEKLQAQIRQLIPERSVLDILCNVEHWLNWTRHFGPISGNEPRLKQPTERYIFTTFGYGCNLGPNEIARHSRDVVTSHMISYTNRRHITTPKIEAAIRDIINSYNRFSLPSIWGTGKKVAADGSKFEIYENNLHSEYHIRYGGYGGIAYHHVSDKYIALFTHFITCGVWEAVYILDGLLKNVSDIQPDTVCGDTQSQSAPVFALSYLLGIKLMPRIRNWKDLSFLRPTEDARYEYIEPLFKGTVNWNLIKTHWFDMMRVVLSIKAGKVMPSTLWRFYYQSE